MFKEIDDIKKVLIEYGAREDEFEEIWAEGNKLARERLANTDYQLLDIKRKMEVIKILCLLTHLTTTYGYKININKILEHFAKVSFFGAANMIKKTDMGDNMSISISRMILNI